MQRFLRGTILILLLAPVLAGRMPAGAQDAVWNLRTPEWKAAWATLPAEDEPDLRLIAVASQLAAYSGAFLPVAPVAPGIDAGLHPGQVPVDIAWFDAPEGVLAFGVASGWAHQVLGHVPLAEPGSAQDIAAWSVGVRYGREDAAAGDAWAARFLAEFGRPVEPLLAQLCARGEGARVTRIADAYESVVGLRPQAPCSDAPVPVAAPLLDCSAQFDACRADAEASAGACNAACAASQCALACSSGSYEQCSGCTASCARGCNSTAAEAWDACDDGFDRCEADD